MEYKHQQPTKQLGEKIHWHLSFRSYVDNQIFGLLFDGIKSQISSVRSLVIGAVAFLILVASVNVQAQNLRELVPLRAPHCALTSPPANAGLAISPGGFIVMHPRGVDVPSDYTGCRVLWVADSDTIFRRFATLYFKQGQLAVAVAHEPQDERATVRTACAFPSSKSLMRAPGNKSDSNCRGILEEPLYGLKPESYPRVCMQRPDAPECNVPR